MLKLLEELNSKQLEAVEKTEGPCLVIAGAGSGKTKVLTYKIAHLIENNNVMPWNILAITFTNKAANEMKERVQKLVGNAISDIWLGTFHSICVRILRKFIDKLGYSENFVIFDTTDQKTLIKKCLKELDLDPKIYSEKSVLNEISNAKNMLLKPDEYEKEYQLDYRKSNIAKVYKLYQKRLKENNSVDFDDIINLTIDILKDNEDVLDYYQSKFKYILVDEYQDTNKSQFLLVSMIANKFKNITVVGDNDQGIYSFRGADVTNILNFEKDFENTKIVKLEQNYRCTGNILKAANSVIKNNRSKYDKSLWTDNDTGDEPIVYNAEDEYDESYFITKNINNLVSEKSCKYNDFAVLYRTNSQSRAIEDILRRENIPYRIFGGLKFYERKEIKDIIAYLRLISNKNDNLALIRIINEPKRGVGATSLSKIEELAIENNKSMFEIIKHADMFLPRIFANTRDFVNLIEELGTLELNLTDLVKEMLKKSNYLESLKLENTLEAESRIENIEEFLSVVMEFEKESVDKSLNEFLQSISLSTDMDNSEESDEQITLMTLHSAKGLEYPVVFLVGLEEGIFPGFQSINSQDDIEEERRLFYVGITRAKKNLFISYAKKRTLFGSTSYNYPSRFVNELPVELIGKTNETKNNFANIKTKEKTEIKFNFRSPESFLSNLANKNKSKLNLNEYKVGVNVFHKKFGNGQITGVEPEGDDLKLDIMFEKYGRKRLMAKFANLDIV